MPLFIIPVLFVVARLFTGAVTAGLIYFFLKSVVGPVLDRFDQQIRDLAQQSYSIELVAEAARFLDLSWAVSVLLMASGAAFSLKLMMVAVRAFGIKT